MKLGPLCFLWLAPLLSAQTWTTIDYPGAEGSAARFISNSGHILGRWMDTAGRWHGFLMDPAGNFTNIACAGALQTRPNAINARGEIVGSLLDAERVWHSFYMGEVTGPCFTIDPKGSAGKDSSTGAFGISDAGEIAGQYQDAAGKYHGYLMRGEVYLFFDIVDGSTNGAWGMTPDGDIFGHFQATGDRMKGFHLGKEKLTVIEFPPAEQNSMTCPFGANSKGHLVGHYQRTGAQVRGFLFTGNDYIPFDFPDAIRTDGNGINDSGVIVGFYIDKNNKSHGFSLRP